MFSPGAGYDPTQVAPPHHDHTLPVLPRAQLHAGAGICLSSFSSALEPFATDPRLRKNKPQQPQQAPYSFLQAAVAAGAAGAGAVAAGAGAARPPLPPGAAAFAAVAASGGG